MRGIRQSARAKQSHECAASPNGVISSKRVTQALISLALGISLSALFGLMAGRPFLTRWGPGGPSMALDTSAGVILAAVGLWLAQSKSVRAVRFIASCLILLIS